MRVLFVWPICRFSVWDVARGYRAALEKVLGADNVRDYFLDKHTAYHRRALPPEAANDTSIISKYASEQVLNEALYFSADVVLIMSGLNFHPIGLWLLNKAHIPAAILFTESPYNDVDQEDWASAFPGMLCMTNDQVSTDRYGWTYIPHAFDPSIHRPVESYPGAKCDVVLVGTGWKERQLLLESINWDGINFRFYGIWPDLTEDSPIYKFNTNSIIDNSLISQVYCSAKICLNIHRNGDGALSLGPRAYEIAASGVFQISDGRSEMHSVFGDSVPIYEDAADLEHLIRYYLDPAHDAERVAMAAESMRRVQMCTFDERAKIMVDALEHHIAQSKPHLVPFTVSTVVGGPVSIDPSDPSDPAIESFDQVQKEM